ncbi:MAG: hypothetical protein Q9160_002553 [Pyrenula sp. 1 TL-2023]
MMHPSRQAYVEEEAEDADMGGVDLASIPIDRDYDLPATQAGIAPERASAILSQFDRKRRAAQLAVPTDDGRVRARLRELGEPITLFGEGPGDRRDRLRELLSSQLEAEGDGDVSIGDAAISPEEPAEEEQEEEFYTEGSQGLLEARRAIAKYSLPRAKERILRQRQESAIPLRTHIKHRKNVKAQLSTFDLFGTQIAGDRPVSITRFSPSGELVAAGNWAGGIKLLSVPNLEEKAVLRGHTGNVGGLSWFPGATLPSSTVSAGSVNLASGALGQEGQHNVHLWSLEHDTPLATLSGHTDRVARVAFHPSGSYLASASFDTSWRLWDVNAQSELLLQEGHSRPVFAVSFNADGSLLASGGYDSMGRIWDLRTGRTVMILDGHIREIFALDWGSDGYRVLTGSGDGWVKCWDIRAVRGIGGLGAHTSNVTDLRWFSGNMSAVDSMYTQQTNGVGEASTEPKSYTSDVPPSTAGTFFVTSGFDKNVNVYSADDWALVKTLSGHSGNVLSCDVSDDARWIASCGHDRTVKLWGMEEYIPDDEW